MNPETEPEKKTINEWASIDGIIIVDPDGFDRSDLDLFNRLYTRSEYEEGIMLCSIMMRGGE